MFTEIEDHSSQLDFTAKVYLPSSSKDLGGYSDDINFIPSQRISLNPSAVKLAAKEIRWYESLITQHRLVDFPLHSYCWLLR
jgi:hypothetical protein